MRKWIKGAAALAFAMAAGAPALAAEGAIIRASDPAGIVAALDAAGYSPKLSTDRTGDPQIEVELGGWSSYIYFYECDDTTHQGCKSLQFSVGFDRKKPWTAKAALDISKKYRFASVHLDDDGDPYVSWDVRVDDGIPTKVFLATVLDFTSTVESAADLVFADER